MEQPVTTLIITQARTGSTRLPGKVLLKVNGDGDELLKIHLQRLNKAKLKDKVIVATTTLPADSVIVSLCKQWGVETYMGSEDDVLDRFYQACITIKPKWVVRVTSDCPLIDPCLIDAVIAYAQTSEVDYCSNTLIENYPDGQDVEVFKFSALEKAWNEAKLKSEREHVTPYITTNSNIRGGIIFSAINLPCISNFSNIRMTVDHAADFELIKKLILDLGTDQSWLTYTKHIEKNQLHKINENIVRNEGFLKSVKND